MIPRGSVFENHLEIGIQKAAWCHSGVYGKEYLHPDTNTKTVSPIPVIPNRGHNMKLKRDDTYRKGSDDVEELRPKPGYTDPGRPIYNRPRGPVYTSGTLNEALTGNYYNYRPDLSLSDSRPIGHGKSWGNGRSATVARGGLVPEASRGVGQPTIDGFINNNQMAQWRGMDEATRQKVLTAYIRSQLLQKQN